jgi:hypothetical protein
MVMRILLAFVLLVATHTAYSADGCIEGSEYEPRLCPLNLPKVVSLSITNNAVKAQAETDPAVSCKSFQVSERQVRKFLKLAKLANGGDTHSTLDWSPCYASGEVLFSDGRSAHWYAEQYQSGSLTFEGSDELILYCPQCKFKPFMWSGVAWPYQEK